MLLYHGTTRRSAEQIAVEGFAPRKPSRRVWFAQSKGYALRRAKVKARRGRDRPAVLLCELDLAALRHKLGSKRVLYRAGIVSINGTLPVTVLRHAPRGVGSAILGTGAGGVVERRVGPQSASRGQPQ